MEIMRPPKKRNAGGSRAAPRALATAAGDARFERVSRWLFWIILFAATAVVFWVR
jgi:hypothetical protein